MRQTTDVANRVAGGDLDARLGPLRLGTVHAEVERAFRTAVNGMRDVMDACVRESSAAIVAASERRFGVSRRSSRRPRATATATATASFPSRSTCAPRSTASLKRSAPLNAEVPTARRPTVP